MATLDYLWFVIQTNLTYTYPLLSPHCIRGQIDQVWVLTRKEYLAASINDHHVNPSHLSSYTLPPNVRATTDPAAALAHAHSIVHCIPLQASEAFLTVRALSCRVCCQPCYPQFLFKVFYLQTFVSTSPCYPFELSHSPFSPPTLIFIYIYICV